MTFAEIQTEVANRLNLTSAESLTRLGNYINQRYRRLTSSLGLNASRRSTANVNTVNGTDNVTFSLEKIELVYILAAGKKRVLPQMQFEEFRQRGVEQPLSGVPKEHAIISSTSNSVTVGLYPTPNAVITIYADGLSNASTLSGSNVPNFPADFHDALIVGAMSDELFKMEKYPLAKDFQKQYEDRVSDLRLFLAKSAMLSTTDTEYPGSGLLTVYRRRRMP